MELEPDSRAAEIAGETLDSAVEIAQGKGLDVEHAIVLLHVTGTEPGERDSVTSMMGYETDEAALEALFLFFSAAMRSEGYDVRVVNIGGDG